MASDYRPVATRQIVEGCDPAALERALGYVVEQTDRSAERAVAAVNALRHDLPRIVSEGVTAGNRHLIDDSELGALFWRKAADHVATHARSRAGDWLFSRLITVLAVALVGQQLKTQSAK